MKRPNLLISVTGGAKDFTLKPGLMDIFRHSLVKAAESTGILMYLYKVNYYCLMFVFTFHIHMSGVYPLCARPTKGYKTGIGFILSDRGHSRGCLSISEFFLGRTVRVLLTAEVDISSRTISADVTCPERCQYSACFSGVREVAAHIFPPSSQCILQPLVLLYSDMKHVFTVTVFS